MKIVIIHAWCEVLQRECPWEFDGNTILVGHSCGATYICDILNRERREPIRASFLVGGFIEDIGDDFYDSRNYTFTHANFDWSLIKKYARKIVVLHGDNDPYVPVSAAKNLAKKLDIDPIFIKGGGHLNAEAGYTKFPYLLDLIRETIDREA
ncbi:alpha/beta hydrolase [Candidatus Saccharibacteria bacterium]|nr:alpha/beta hydrolase [Candidatus Saccharibacteria bacterium]MCL1963367.1 alpha/beta hydrolase [Candidatus Saccharibacteria bacterium]